MFFTSVVASFKWHYSVQSSFINRFEVVDLLLYIKKEKATEYIGMWIVPGWGGPALLHEGLGNQKEHGWLAEQQAPFHYFCHA